MSSAASFGADTWSAGPQNKMRHSSKGFMRALRLDLAMMMVVILHILSFRVESTSLWPRK